MAGRHGRAFLRIMDALASEGCGPRDYGTHLTARCPAHHDRSPSLKMSDASEFEGALLHCHAGCEAVDVLAALGLGLTDLYDQERQPDEPTRRRPPPPRGVTTVETASGRVTIDAAHLVERIGQHHADLSDASWWMERAAEFDAAAQRVGEFHGRATVEELEAGWRRCRASAAACWRRAMELDPPPDGHTEFPERPMPDFRSEVSR